MPLFEFHNIGWGHRTLTEHTNRMTNDKSINDTNFYSLLVGSGKYM